MLRRLCVALALALSCAAGWAQNAGNVARVHPAGFLTHGSATHEAKVSDPLAWADIVRTDEAGRVAIALSDGSALTVGAKSEMRIVKNDPSSQQSTLELLYGRMRAKVTPVTQKGGSFQVHTPTAVIGVIGTGFAVQVDTASASVSGTVTQQDISKLPTGGRSTTDLAQLTPGAMPGGADQPTIADFPGQTIVYGLDHLTGVRNIDPKVQGIVYLLPGEFTIVRRGQPPTPPQMAKSQDLFDDPQQPYGPEEACVLFVDLSNLPGGSPASYTITGMGTSTGDVFQVHVKNAGGCTLLVFVPAGAILKPTGFTERLIKGLFLGGNPSLKDFQIMIVTGAMEEVGPNGEITFIVRAYCLELHKLAPHPKTRYEFEDPGRQAALAENRRLIDTGTRLFYTGQLTSAQHPLDSILQWAIWAFREKLDEKSFHEEFFKLVKKNIEASKGKWDKDTERKVLADEQLLWPAMNNIRLTTERDLETTGK